MRFANNNRLKVTLALLGCVLTALLLAFPPQHVVLAADNELAAIYRNGLLEVSIPYNAELTRSGSFTLEIVDPRDSVIAQQQKPVSTSRDSGPWRATISLDKKVALEDLAWDRLKISAGEESTIVSLSEILHLPVVKIFAQSSYAAGSAASARIITLDSKSTNPLRGSLLKVELIDGEHSSPLFTGRTDAFGTAQVAFTIPAGTYGGRQLRVSAETSLGSVVANQPIQLEARDKILLTTDKPIYQPAQTIHLRALAFDGPTRNAAADRPITLEVEDAKGNKVFKNRGRTDRFGIASADFELADEVNCGAYHIRALLGDEGAQKMQEKTVTVDRYTLPKFKVDIELGASDRAQQRASYYSPGETVSGSITARYLFGKPLTNAEVTLTMTTFDVQSVELARITGKTDKEGRLAFSSKLPDFLAGRPMQQGSAPVAIAAQVKDTAEHVETKSRDILVSRTPILIMAVPESGQLMPGLENRVYILTSYPDGAPARTIVTGSIEKGQVETDASGVAIVTLKAANGPIELSLKATDSKGRSAQTNVKLESQVGSQSLMLRTNKSVYKVGEKLELETISTKPRGAIYLDVVKDGQTLITRAIESKGNRGDLTLDLTPSMFGTIEVRAYQIMPDADPISDRRLVYVDPADDLKVEASVEHECYAPGEDASISFRVTDKMGRPVSAALGIEIVDEAVFALSDKHPGFEKVFMYLEKELLTPRYEVHQFSFDSVVINDFDGDKPLEARESAARVLLAAAATARNRDIRAEFGRGALEAKRSDYAALYQDRVFQRTQVLAKAMTEYYERRTAAREGFGRDIESFVSEDRARRQLLEDPWGSALIGEGTLNDSGPSWVTVRSAGPDRRDKTADDIAIAIYAQRDPTRVASTQSRGRVNVSSGTVAGGRVSIEGVVKDGTGNPIAGVGIAAERVSNARTIWGYTDSAGRFSIANLAPGKYRVRFESKGSRSSFYKTLSLEAGQRGTVAAIVETNSIAPVTLAVYPVNGRITFTGGVAGIAGGRFEKGKIENLPLNGRDFLARAQLEPGDVGKPLAAPVANEELRSRKLDQKDSGDNDGSPRVRTFFPETLYTNPALITDGQGRASIRIPLADSITTWRVTSLASTTRGALGSSSSPLRVFQDFFVDLDLPISATEGDALSVPVAVYNYLTGPQRVSLELRQDPWFTLDSDVAAKQVEVKAGEVTVAYFRIKASRIGEHQLQVTAKLENAPAGQKGDAVARTLNVLPNGEEHAVVINERLEGEATKEILIPDSAIADASKIFVKFYPGALSQAVEGLDSILRMPGGCFEQTSSSTYPNVLVMDYLKASKKITPEIQAKAEGYISLGYQRLVTFEVKGGGFSWFGEAPANKILTAYGLMEFSDMSRVHEVDPRLIERTQAWLAGQQQQDGSFKPDTYFINEGATNRYNNDIVRITAYLGWALASTGYKGEAIDKAKQFVSSHVTGNEDAYTLAVIANFAADYARDRDWTDAAIKALAAKATEDQTTAHWKQEGETPTSARNDSADLETTALAAQAMLKSGQKSGLAKKALDYLTAKKDAMGNWQTTQATILALKAFALSFTKGASADTAGTIVVSCDGKAVERVQITKDNNDLLHLIDLKGYTHQGAHKIGLAFSGHGSMQYQIVGRYYTPWELRAGGAAAEALSISVSYDRTKLAQDETATARVRVQNNTRALAKMIMVDLGIPPGFEVSRDELEALVDSTRGKSGGKLEKYTITGKQVILYFDGLNAKQVVGFSYKLRAKFPVRAQTFSSRVYEYYNPTVEDKAKPVEMTVVAR